MRIFFAVISLAMAVMSGAIYYMGGDSFDRLDYSIWSAVCVLIGYMEFRK